MKSNISIPLPVDELRPALAGMAKVIPRSPRLPVLGTVKITRDSEGWITLTGTDNSTFVTVRLERPTPGDPGTVLVPHAELARIAKSQGKDTHLDIVAEDEESEIQIRYPVGAQHVSVPIAPIATDEFPALPRTEGQEVAIDESIRRSLLEALSCSSQDETRYVLQGAYLDVSDPKAHHLIGTNGRHLYSANSFRLQLPDPVIIPSRKFFDWRPFQLDGEWRLSVTPPETQDGESPTWLRIANRRWTMVVQAIAGTYPNYRQVLPKATDVRTTVDLGPSGTTALLDVLSKLPGSEMKDKPVYLRVEGASLSVSGQHSDGQESERLQIETSRISGSDIFIALNRDYLAKALRFGLSRIELIDPCSPLRLSEGGRQLIIMPMRTAITSTEAEPNNPQVSEPQKPSDSVPEPEPPIKQTEPMKPSATQNTKTNTSGSALEGAIARTDELKTAFRALSGALADLSTQLRQAVREQKVEAKELHSVRQTIRQLQSYKL